MPKISVIVPVHDVASYLEETVASILRQDFDDYEIVLVENLSTDGSEQICRELCKADPHVRMLTLSQAGLSIARNAAIRDSSAEFVCFVDGDDTIEPDMLSSMYHAAVEAGVDMVTANYVIESEGKKPVYNYQEDGRIRRLTHAELLYGILSENICSSACTALYRRSLFNRLEFPEGRYFEDHAVTYLLADECKAGGVHIGRSFYHYLQREDSICHSMDFRKYADYCKGNLERILFVESSDDLDHDQKKSLHTQLIRLFVGNFRKAVAFYDDTDEEQTRTTDQFRALIPHLLALHASGFKTVSRLFRMKWCWKNYCVKHRKK